MKTRSSTQAVPCLRFPPSARAELGKLLAAARPPELLFGLLFARGFLVQMLRPKRTQLAPSDVLLVMNTAGPLPSPASSTPTAPRTGASLPPPPRAMAIVGAAARAGVELGRVPRGRVVAAALPPAVRPTPCSCSVDPRSTVPTAPRGGSRYNRGGFLYAHVSFVAPELCLVFITAGRDAFGALSAARAQACRRAAAGDPAIYRLRMMSLRPHPHRL